MAAPQTKPLDCACAVSQSSSELARLLHRCRYGVGDARRFAVRQPVAASSRRRGSVRGARPGQSHPRQLRPGAVGGAHPRHPAGRACDGFGASGPPQRSCCSSYRCATRGPCASVAARRPWSTNQSNTSPWLVQRGPAAWAASLAVELTWSGRARRCRYRSNLLEQPHQVEVVPRLGDLVTPDLDHLDRLNYNALSSRRDGAERSSQLARVSAIPRDLEDCIVATAERLGDRSGRVGERALPVLGRFDGVVDSKAPLRRQLLVRRVGREGRFEPTPISSVVRVDVFPRNRKRICHTPYLHARSPGIPPSVTASGRTASMVRRYPALQPIAFGA